MGKARVEIEITYGHVSLYVYIKLPKINTNKTPFLRNSMAFEFHDYKIDQMLNKNYRIYNDNYKI